MEISAIQTGGGIFCEDCRE